MCGINGIVSLDAGAPSRHELKRMADAQKHRGPDGEGFHIDGKVGFGHRRLSILDLSEAGAQPMNSADDKLVITYNGEVYNYVELRDELKALGHTFHTGTDTEVILAAYQQWGVASLSRFNGMFAFAIHDRRDGSVILARDPFGIKPLFYHIFNGRLAFASEIKAILALDGVRRAPHWPAIVRFLDSGSTDCGPETCFEGILHIEPGHILTIRAGKVDVKAWWNPAPSPAPTDPVKAFRATFLDAVRISLRSDVPVGVTLSGGLDSSSIGSAMHEIAPKKRFEAFTAGFPGAKHDETRYARLVAEAKNLTSHVVNPSEDDLLKALPDIIRHQDEPFPSTSIFAQWEVARLIRDNGVKVAMDGQGSDEILAGYDYLYASYFRGLLGHPVRLAKAIHAYRKAKRSNYALKVLALSVAPRALQRRIARSKILHPDLARFRGPDPFIESTLRAKTLNEALAAHVKFRLAPLLRYSDRNAMAHSIEARVPFLDTRLVQLCNSLPPEWKIRDGTTKAVLRDAVKGLVPDEILARTDKIGFQTNEAEWLRSKRARSWIEACLTAAAAGPRPLADRKGLSKLWEAHLGGQDHSRVLWRIICAELWLRSFMAPALRPSSGPSIGHVLVVAHSYPDADNRYIGGIFVKEQVAALVRRGLRVTVLCPLPRGIELRRKARFSDYEHDGAKVVFLRYVNHPTLYRRMRHLWVKREAAAVRSWVMDSGPFSIIHGHFMWPSGALGVELGRSLGIPVVVTEHLNSLPDALMRGNDAFLSRQYRAAQLVLRVNALDVVPLGTATGGAKVEFLPNGYDPRKVSRKGVVPARVNEAPRPRILAVGNLVRQKGHDILIEALRVLQQRGIKASCAVAGGGPDLARLRAAAQAKGLDGYIDFLGRVTDGELAALYGWCDVLAVPSRSESYGIVQLEAMAAGKPIVATATAGSQTVLADAHDACIMVKIESAAALADGLEQALRRRWDPDAIRRHASGKAWDDVAERLVVAYRALLQPT